MHCGRPIAILDLAQPGTGKCPGGKYPEGKYPGGKYPEGKYPEGKYPEGKYAKGKYPGRRGKLTLRICPRHVSFSDTLLYTIS